MKKTEERISYFRKAGVRFVDTMPVGWQEMRGALTAPTGYEWIWNPKTQERALLKCAKVVAMDNSKMKQYDELKKKHPDAVILFRNGDYYEAYRDDARTVCEVCGFEFCLRDGVDFAGFSSHQLDIYLPKLVRAGKRIAICDQLEDVSKVRKSITERVEKKEPIQLSINF